MKKALVFFLKYYLFWFIFFIGYKCLFLIYNFEATLSFIKTDLWGVFSHGSKMDFSVAGYFSLIPGILLALTSFISFSAIRKIINTYTYILLGIVTVMGILDFALYPYWGSRLSSQILLYLENPGGMIACVTWWQIILIIAGNIFLYLVFFFLYKFIFRNQSCYKEKSNWWSTPIMLVLTAALILPIRGGLDTSPLNHSSVYFSKNIHANQAAYNYFWSFGYSLTNNSYTENPINYMSKSECEAQMKGLNKYSSEQIPTYISSKNGKPINVIVVILESFSDKVIEPLGGLKGITPCLNALCKEGIAFDSFYASGNRSDKGISAIIGEYPALVKGSSILAFPDKMKTLHSFPKYFKEHNYDLSFYYGGDVNFYNTRALMMQSGVDEIISKESFPSKISSMQRWGVPDEHLYSRMAADLQRKKKPFLSIVYNISSHEPFDVPNFKRIADGRPSEAYCNAIAYSDSCLGAFISSIKKSSLWKNTLIVITSDHTSLEPGPTSIIEPASYRIPLIWVGGVLDSSFVSKHFGGQTDIGTTLVQQMGWKHKPNIFSKNLFGSQDYAFYIREIGWGFMSPQTGFFMNRDPKSINLFYIKNPAKQDSLMHFSKAYVQYIHEDFINRR